MTVTARLRSVIKSARKRDAAWVPALDAVRLLATSDGRSRLWTRIILGREVHQLTTATADDRYPDLFDLAASLEPNAERILSFGCSTGEELVAIRHRFPRARIVGAEINPRARRIAARKAATDPAMDVVPPQLVRGPFDIVFALAVLQREPHKVSEMDVQNIAHHYPFARFDAAVSHLAGLLRPGGFLCVFHCQYRVEDCSAARSLEAVPAAPAMQGPLFAPDGQRRTAPTAGSMFRKRN
jgi:SAM-dependent methyltransferase